MTFSILERRLAVGDHLVAQDIGSLFEAVKERRLLMHPAMQRNSTLDDPPAPRETRAGHTKHVGPKQICVYEIEATTANDSSDGIYGADQHPRVGAKWAREIRRPVNPDSSLFQRLYVWAGSFKSTDLHVDTMRSDCLREPCNPGFSATKPKASNDAQHADLSMR